MTVGWTRRATARRPSDLALGVVFAVALASGARPNRAAVIADGSGYLAVGTVGAPDNFIP